MIGIGRLGHLGVKFAHALGAHVVAFTTSPNKRESILALGADEVVLSTDPDQMAAQTGRFEFVLDTVSTSYPMNPILNTLKLDGTLCSLGVPDHFDFHPGVLTGRRRRLTSSFTGGTREIQEMLAFRAAHRITTDIEIITPDHLNTALDRLAANDVRYRFVLDLTQR